MLEGTDQGLCCLGCGCLGSGEVRERLPAFTESSVSQAVLMLFSVQEENLEREDRNELRYLSSGIKHMKVF